MTTQTYIFVPGFQPTWDSSDKAELTDEVGWLDILQPVPHAGEEWVMVRIANRALLVKRDDLRKVLEHLG